jgi:hypothetical protein
MPHQAVQATIVAATTVAPKFSPAPTAIDSAPARPPLAAKSRAQMMREVEQDPYVQSCLDIFGGEIVRIDPPRPVASGVPKPANGGNQ